MISEILTLAKAFGGTALPPDEEELLLRLCEEAFIQWGCRLRKGIEPEGCAGALIPACAWTALAGLLTSRQAAGSPISFRAGDISVQQGPGDGQQGIRLLHQQAQDIMRPYMVDEGFVFRGVRG